MQKEFSGRGGVAPALEAALERLDRLVNWERADRSSGSPGATAVRRVDLGPARDLMERLGNPQKRFRAVHVAGTKGKGSVASLIAAALSRAGRTVGLYTSPHVERVQERVAIGGEPVGDEALAAQLVRTLDARAAAERDGSPAAAASWFDVMTGAAFGAFAAAEVDAAVVEVGLGGRLDSTNVVDGEVAVVTNIDLEHTAILGETRAAIAAEKAGIVKPGAAVVTGVSSDDAEAWPAIAAAAERSGARLIPIEVGSGATIEAGNRALAAAALAAFGADAALLDEATVRAARLPGRLEELRAEGGPAVVLDGAHVPSSLAAVLDELRGRPGLGSAPTVVLGTGLDKDASGLLKVLAGRVDRVLCTSVGAGPYRPPGLLLAEAERAGLVAEKATSPRVAFEAALRHSRPDGWVLVTGSLHLVGAVRSLISAPLEKSNPAC